ncbi:hypothetical protein HMPREF3156_01622 [Neisseria sp. HMSC06F02]|nr:hypothetical protein HMPREF3156_01622 [Neisseria sp. HMSC06F02]
MVFRRPSLSQQPYRSFSAIFRRPFDNPVAKSIIITAISVQPPYPERFA